MIPHLHGPLAVGGQTVVRIAWTVAIALGLFAASVAIVAAVLVNMPATYLLDGDETRARSDRHPVLRWTVRIAKNLLGVVLLAVGIVMLLTPGQGLLTILAGLMLLDFPGRRRLLRRLVGRPAVLHAINQLRARFGKPPVVVE